MGLGWDGWDGNARTTSGRPGRQRTRLGQLLSLPHCSWRGGEGNSFSRRIWEHPRAAAAHLQAAKTWEKVLQKVHFCPWFGFSALTLARERLGFPCRGSGGCSLISRVACGQVGVEVGLERGSQKLWNLQNHFHHVKIRDLPGLPARLPGAAQRAAGAFPFPFPRLPSPPGSLG